MGARSSRSEPQDPRLLLLPQAHVPKCLHRHRRDPIPLLLHSGVLHRQVEAHSLPMRWLRQDSVEEQDGSREGKVEGRLPLRSYSLVRAWLEVQGPPQRREGRNSVTDTSIFFICVAVVLIVWSICDAIKRRKS